MTIELLPPNDGEPYPARRDPALLRVRRGVYVEREAFGSLREYDHYPLKVRAVAAVRPSAVLARESALALDGLPYGRPERVFTIGGTSTSGTRAGVSHSQVSIADDDVQVVDGIARCTTAYALAHLARVGRQVDAVSALDEALRRQVVTIEAVQDALSRQGPRGRRRAERVIGFADPLSESVGESWSRVAIHRIGATPPLLQVPIETSIGTRRPDFLFERPGRRPLGGEFDGFAKYGAIADANGKQPVDVVVAEKRRDDALREHIDTLHWMWREAQYPLELRALLARHHVPVGSVLLPGW